MPTARKMLSGVASALFIARRIQAGLAANIRPSSTNRIPTPMRKSANAMDLIGLEPPVFKLFLLLVGAWLPPCPLLVRHYGSAGADGGVAEGMPALFFPEPSIYLKKSESGRSRKRVSLLFSPFS